MGEGLGTSDKAIDRGTRGSYVGRGFVVAVSSLLALLPLLLMAALGVALPLPPVLPLRPRVFAWLFWEASCGFGWRRWFAQKGAMLCDRIGRGGKSLRGGCWRLGEAPGTFATGRMKDGASETNAKLRMELSKKERRCRTLVAGKDAWM